MGTLICRFVCHGLNTGDKCVFRVKAVNAAGYSTYSSESEQCLVKAAIGESHSKRSFKDVADLFIEICNIISAHAISIRTNAIDH